MKLNFYTVGGTFILIGIIVLITMIIIQKNKDTCETISKIPCHEIDKK